MIGVSLDKRLKQLPGFCLPARLYELDGFAEAVGIHPDYMLPPRFTPCYLLIPHFEWSFAFDERRTMFWSCSLRHNGHPRPLAAAATEDYCIPLGNLRNGLRRGNVWQSQPRVSRIWSKIVCL